MPSEEAVKMNNADVGVFAEAVAVNSQNRNSLFSDDLLNSDAVFVIHVD